MYPNSAIQWPLYSSVPRYCFRPLVLDGDPKGPFPATSLSGTNVTCGEDLADVLVGVLRRLHGGLPSSASEFSLEPPKQKSGRLKLQKER